MAPDEDQLCSLSAQPWTIRPGKEPRGERGEEGCVGWWETVAACWAPGEPGAGTYPASPPWSAQIALLGPSPRAPCARPGAPRTCRPPCAGLRGGRADRAHRWRRLGRRGPEGDVTGSGPGGRNRAAAASVAQQRAAAAQRAGAATTSRAPGTRRPSERPTEGRGARSRHRCRHGALPPAQVRPPGLLGPGRLRYAGAGRVASRRH